MSSMSCKDGEGQGDVVGSDKGQIVLGCRTASPMFLYHIKEQKGSHQVLEGEDVDPFHPSSHLHFSDLSIWKSSVLREL